MIEHKYRIWLKTEQRMRYNVPSNPRDYLYFTQPCKKYLMQYSNFKDKHGKEIYAEDLIKDDFGEIHRVYFDCGSFLIAPGSDDIGTLFYLSPEDCVEKIGNTYENPELYRQNDK